MIISMGKEEDLYQWHDWFVWYPVIYTSRSGNRSFIWLRKVQRKCRMTYVGVACDIRNRDGSEIP